VTCWAVIPIKATADSKSRLADVLNTSEREALVGAMLAHVVSAARSATMISRIFLIGPSRCGISEEIPLLDDPGTGLNPAVQSGMAEIARASSDRPDRILILFADLPEVTPRELDLLAITPTDTIAIAADRHQTGTNAISLPLPTGADFIFAFGPDSFAKHQKEAHRLGFKIETILSCGLERDIDEANDLPDAKAALRQMQLHQIQQQLCRERHKNG